MKPVAGGRPLRWRRKTSLDSNVMRPRLAEFVGSAEGDATQKTTPAIKSAPVTKKTNAPFLRRICGDECARPLAMPLVRFAGLIANVDAVISLTHHFSGVELAIKLQLLFVFRRRGPGITFSSIAALRPMKPTRQLAARRRKTKGNI